MKPTTRMQVANLLDTIDSLRDELAEIRADPGEPWLSAGMNMLATYICHSLPGKRSASIEKAHSEFVSLVRTLVSIVPESKLPPCTKRNAKPQKKGTNEGRDQKKNRGSPASRRGRDTGCP